MAEAGSARRPVAGAPARAALAVGVLVALTTMPAAPAAADAVAPRGVAQRCTSETYLWDGSVDGAAVEIGGEGPASADTAIVIGAVAGTTLRVEGAAADGVAADGTAVALGVTVGGVPADVGAVVPGGAVAVVTSSAVPLRVSGATVVVARCVEVAAAPPVARPARTLPSTGWSGGWESAGRLLLGTALVGLGALLVVANRPRLRR